MRISDWSSDVCSSDLWGTSHIYGQIFRHDPSGKEASGHQRERGGIEFVHFDVCGKEAMCRPTLQNASELRQKRLRHGPKLAQFGIMKTVLKIFVQHHGGPFREASVLVGHSSEEHTYKPPTIMRIT